MTLFTRCPLSGEGIYTFDEEGELYENPSIRLDSYDFIIKSWVCDYTEGTYFPCIHFHRKDKPSSKPVAWAYITEKQRDRVYDSLCKGELDAD